MFQLAERHFTEQLEELITKKISVRDAYLITIIALVVFYLALIGFNRIVFLLSPIVPLHGVSLKHYFEGSSVLSLIDTKRIKNRK